jgi:3-hydroxybutyryl-CoA dehydrogenase
MQSSFVEQIRISMIETTDKVGVVGLGVMGFDIAFLYAMKGYSTTVYDASKQVMASLADRRDQTIERLKRRNRITDGEAESARNGLVPAIDLASMAQLSLVTEAVSETLKIKLAVYQALRDAGFGGILTTNTSSLARASLLASKAYDHRKFALTHFFNPVLYTQMVEVVKGDMEEANYEIVRCFLKSLGRDPIETKDISGFVSNSILMYYAVMALRLLEAGAAIESIDQAAKGLRFLPPLISFDSWRPSIVEDVTRAMFELRGDPFLRSSNLLSLLAKDNPKFYIDQKPNEKIYQRIDQPRRQLGEPSIMRALKTTILVAAARVVELGESPATVDFVAIEGIKIPEPPLKQIDSLGPAALIEELAKINREMPQLSLNAPQLLTAMASQGEPFYRNEQPNPWLLSRVQPSSPHASD